MSSPSAGRVSRGGRRNITVAPGTDIMRKSATSKALPASMFRIHEGNSPNAETLNSNAIVNKQTNSRGARVELGKHFNLHLLRSDVVSDVLSRHRQLVRARNGLAGDKHFAGAGRRLRIPAQLDRRFALEAGD